MSETQATVSGSKVVFLCEDRAFDFRDVIDAAHFRGEKVERRGRQQPHFAADDGRCTEIRNRQHEGEQRAAAHCRKDQRERDLEETAPRTGDAVSP